MVPRKKLDIGWHDCVYGMFRCLAEGDRSRIESVLRSRIARPESATFCLSARSGFDAILRALALPAGSEVLVSAITIPDMVRILEVHGLTPVPVDLDPETLFVDGADLAQAVGQRTRAILVTHLFGGRMPMDPVVACAKRHGLIVIEDCAEAYWGDAYTGHPESDVSLFSFGPIKLNTSLGGALVYVRDPELHRRLNDLQATYPSQSRWRFFRRLAKYCALAFLGRPLPYTLLCAACRATGASHDALTYLATRGFAGDGLFGKLRMQPSGALLALMERRFRSNALERTETRRRLACAFRQRIPDIACPGDAGNSSHWIFPIRVANPEAICHALWPAGIDAHTWPVSLCVVDPCRGQEDRAPARAAALQDQLLFLPVYPGIDDAYLDRMAEIVRDMALVPVKVLA